MMNKYIKMGLMICCLLLVSYANAQFKFGDKSSIGQTLTVDNETGIATFLVDFNTDKPSSSWTTDPEPGISFQKCQTNRGIQSEVFESDAADASTIYNDDFKVRRWNSYENAVHMASIDSMTAIFDKWQELYADTEDSVKNVIWKPSACLFDVGGDAANQAFGTHPGMYKRVEYGFQFSFDGLIVGSDIEFEMDTYDVGNTGETASYSLTVAVGEDTVTLADYYVTGTGMKTVKIAEATGMDYTAWSGEKVYIWLKTQGTNTLIEKGSYDPTVVFDNMSVSYQLPVWISPPAGAQSNLVLGEPNNPLVGEVGVPIATSIPLQTIARTGSLVIVDDLQNRMIKNLSFAETGALKAKDGSGEYTIDVPYTFEPAIFDEGGQLWSKAKITVAPPEGGPVDDDMLLFFEATPSSSNLHFARLELDAGTRIWYDVYMSSTEPSNILYVGASGPESPIGSDSVAIDQLEAAGYQVTLVDDNDVSDGGYDYSPYAAVVYGESTSSSRVVAFGTIDNYPIPAVILEPLSVRDDKWGWVTDRADFTEDRDCLPGTDSMTILDNTHYITEVFDQDQKIAWTTAVCGDPETVAAFGFDLGKYVSEAIPLAKNNSAGVSTPNLWAIPAGSSVENGTKTTENKIVILGIHEFGVFGKDADMTEYATDDFYTLLTRSLEWVLREEVVEPVANLLYVGAQGADNIVPSDSISIEQLKIAGYAVTVVDDNDVADGGYDYSSYDAVIYGESCSSSRVVAFGNTDYFPIPCLMMEPLAVRGDKWGWVINPDPGTYGNSDYPGFKEDRDCQMGTTEMQILNNSHYITQDYAQDTVVAWSSATCGDPESVYAFGFDVNQNMTGGIPLAKNNSLGIEYPNLWALPAGTTVTGDTVTLNNRLVLLGIHELGLYGKDADMTEYATADFYNLLLRSVEWILGNGDDGTVGTREKVEVTRNIMAYPNPAKDWATLRLDLEASSRANLNLVNMMGQRVQLFSNQQLFAGRNEVRIDLNGMLPGMYVYQLEVEGKVFVGKLMIKK